MRHPIQCRRRCCTIAATLVLLSGMGCTSPDPVTGRSTYNLYGVDDDVRLGQAALRQNSSRLQEVGVPMNQDPARLRQLRDMVSRIAAESHMPDLPYSVTLYHTNIVNAAAAPGGSIMVFEGLYDPEIGLVKDDDELAAVLSHEIAHVTCRHVTERLSKTQTASTATDIIGVFAGAAGYGEAYDVASMAFSVGQLVWLPAYSRGDEAEADRVGLFYMADAGYNPEAALRIWKRAAQEGDGADPLSIFSTHPSNATRHEVLSRYLPAAMRRYRGETDGRDNARRRD